MDTAKYNKGKEIDTFYEHLRKKRKADIIRQFRGTRRVHGGESSELKSTLISAIIESKYGRSGFSTWTYYLDERKKLAKESKKKK